MEDTNLKLVTNKLEDLLDYKLPYHYRYSPDINNPVVFYTVQLSNLFGLSHGWMCYITNKILVNYEATH